MNLYGDQKERQKLAIENPIWRIAQAQDELFRRVCELPNGLFFQTTLTVDCYQEPWSWHCATGFLTKPVRLGKQQMRADQLKQQMLELEAVSRVNWTQAEYQLAMSAGRILLSGVGEATSVSWTDASFYDLTFQAWRNLNANELEAATLRMAEIKVIGQFQLTGRARHNGLTVPAALIGH